MLRTYNRKLKKHIGHRIYPIREFNFVFSKRLKNRDISFKSEKREQRSMSILSTKRERERKKQDRDFFFKMQTGIFQFGTIAIRYRIFSLYFYWQVFYFFLFCFYFFFFYALYIPSQNFYSKIYEHTCHHM